VTGTIPSVAPNPTAEAFRDEVLKTFLQDVHRIEQNNYSWERYSFDGVDRSQQVNVARHAMFLAWFGENYRSVFDAYSALADQASRDLYTDILRFRLSGHLHVRIRSAVHTLSAQADRMRAALHGTASTSSLSGMFGNLVHYEGTWEGVTYSVDSIKDSLLYPLVYRQYFLERNEVAIQPEPGDYVVDAGAFIGETTVVFSGRVGPTGKVYAFEPVHNHLDVCRMNFSRPNRENITLFPYAVGNKSIDAPPVFVNEYAPGYRPSPTAAPISTRRIDDLVMDRSIERIDFLKMDVEGAEMSALAGAEASIRHFRPKLAISIYHKPDDFFSIIKYLNALDLGYSFYINHHTIYDEETVVYAKVARR
jgi:FkbM family methyltransferase